MRFVVVLTVLMMLGCTPQPTPPPESAAADPAPKTDADLQAQADELAKKLIIVDTHVDVPYRLTEKPDNISESTESGDFDYPRAVKGGLNAPFMSIYTPAEKQAGGAYEHAEGLLDMVEGFQAQWPDKFAVATSPAQVKEQFGKGLISLPLGMENGAPIEGDMQKLAHFYKRGVRYITLTHGKNNHICDSSYDKERKWQGLSPFGVELVAEMNRLGIMIDVSHISDKTFFQVMELSQAPVMASHSSCRAFTPDFERNMSDEMIKLLAEKDGVIMINFGSTFVDAEIRAWSDELREKARAWAAENNLTEDSKEVWAYYQEIKAKDQRYSTINKVVQHIDHVVQLVGVDHVGLGSDYDGVGDSLPTGLKDVSSYPNLIRELLKKGYSEADIEKICSGNIFRVWSAVEAHAQKAAE